MTRLASLLLTAGVLLFIGVLVSQGLPAVIGTLASAGWGLLLVALFHLLPLVLDGAAVRVLLSGPRAQRDGTLARWVAESVNSLLPAGQIGGPVVMVRLLVLRGRPVGPAGGAVTVAATLQAVGQVLFALLGLGVLGAAAGPSARALHTAVVVAAIMVAVPVAGFYLAQRRGLFGGVMRRLAALGGRPTWGGYVCHAEAIDQAITQNWQRGGAVCASFVLNFAGWLVGTGEVYLILWLMGHPVSWSASLVLESLGQAIRGAAFMVPGGLGVQEGGYLLLAPLVGLPPQTGLALSLAKRSRELLLGLPGLLYLHQAEAGSAALRRQSS
ncbi:MAG TPA: lysylphosphatidylglycerol synthase domain-containing protein [Steroidobacteraceae bacterium]|nr:lysylphosphatidylglycerol synthase domain-containing protein [Steroidobacteraceae bacterium]